MDRAGELAALATALCWGVTALGFEAAGRRVGSLSVNLIRLVIGLGFLTAFCWLVRGLPFPTDATAHAWTWLLLSGLIGFTFGDMCLFRALVIVGSRRASLVMSLSPALAAVLSWLILSEGMTPLDLVGMALTIGGIALAVSERGGEQGGPEGGSRLWWGLALALCGALGQAGGLVVSKHGMGDYDPVAATQVRVIAGIVGFSLMFTVIGWWPRARAAVRDRRGMSFTALGALFGPFLGVSLSLYAVQHAVVGVAASIMATTPIWIIPMVALVHGESTGWRGIVGAVVAVAGVALLFLTG